MMPLIHRSSRDKKPRKCRKNDDSDPSRKFNNFLFSKQPDHLRIFGEPAYFTRTGSAQMAAVPSSEFPGASTRNVISFAPLRLTKIEMGSSIGARSGLRK